MQSLWPVEFLSETLAPNHCADVLGGCYDVPFEGVNPRIIDIGANIGAFCRWAVHVWPKCSIDAFEPHPDNFTKLICTASTTNVRAHPNAISNESGIGYIGHRGYNCGEHFLLEKGDETGIKVRVGDAADLPEADIIKIDTEGEESPIIDRLNETGKLQHFKAVIYEFHARDDMIYLIGLMRGTGFKEFSRDIHSEHRGVFKWLKI